MKEQIEERFLALIDKGKLIIARAGYYEGELAYWLSDTQTPDAHAWINSCANLLTIIAPKRSAFLSNLSALLEDGNFKNGSSVPTHTVQKILGLISSAYDEFKNGFLHDIEFIVFAEAFDDFLSHAERFHRSNKKIESAVLASVVLEDTIKSIAKKADINPDGLTLEPLIDKLQENEIFTPVKARRIKGVCGVRNHALHAEWDKFDITDVGKLIGELKSIITEFL